jgi:TP901 family phage tail tape measure protein
MKYCGTAANQAGESMEGTSAALAVLSNQNLKGSQAGTSLRRIFMVLNNEMSDASKIVRQINPDAQTFAEKMQALHEAGLNSTSAMKLFRIEASSAAVILANNVSQLNDYGNKLEWTAGKSKGFAEQMAATQLDTFQGDLRLAKSALDDVAISLMQAFNTNARGAVQDIVSDLGDLSKWIEENPDKLREWGDTAYGIFKTAEQGVKNT